MVSSPELIRISSDPVLDADIVLIEMWPLRQPDDKHYVAINNEDIVSNGITYSQGWLEVSHPDGTDGDLSISIAMSNITRIPGRILAAEKDQVICRLMEVNAAEPDIILRDTHDLFFLNGGKVDAVTTSSELISRMADNEPLQHGVTGASFPALIVSK